MSTILNYKGKGFDPWLIILLSCVVFFFTFGWFGFGAPTIFDQLGASWCIFELRVYLPAGCVYILTYICFSSGFELLLIYALPCSSMSNSSHYY